ncbi:MAG: hypothetical protein AB8G86_02820 [Saprospiraceae bacterium]
MLLVLFLGIGAFLSSHYRKEVYESGNGNAFIADAGGNIVVVLILCLFFWGFTSKEGTVKINGEFNKVFDVFLVTCFYLLSEIAALFVNFLGVFDIKDIYGYLIGSVFALILVFILDRKEYELFIRKQEKS